MSAVIHGDNLDLLAGSKATEFTKKTLVFDCLALYYVLDEVYAQRCLEGGVNVANVTFAVEENWDATIECIEKGVEKIEKSPCLMLVTKSADVAKAKALSKLGVIMGTQSASMVERKLWRVRLMWRLGLRFLGLAYTGGNLFADGCGEIRNGGLTFLGKELISAVNELPMLLDLSHCGHRTRAEAAELAHAPVCTHSNAYGVSPNDRNTKDETVRTIANKGGAIGICALPKPVKLQNPTLEDLLDHCDHFVKLVGSEHVGIGLDLIEGYKESNVTLPESARWRTWRPDIFGTVEDFQRQSYPRGLQSIRLLPNLTQGLLDRGYTENEIAAILGENWLRVFQKFVG